MHLKYNLSKKILAWYDNNKRTLPWRVGKSSQKKLYYRLLSEFMLQQTQVKTVIPYFKRFVHTLPTLISLSKCSEKRILKLWEGLGYYRRAKNLLATAKILVVQKNSKLPNTLEEIKKFPGVGDYTANALLGLVHNQATIAIDGNVKRVFSRIINKKETEINFEKFILLNKKNLFNSKRNSNFVEALMEFGALICRPKDPNCNICNLKNVCKYFSSSSKINTSKNKIIKSLNYDVFCYINKNKQIALTKKNRLGFLEKFNLPQIKKTKNNNKKNWKFLNKYKNLISNKKLNISVYYKFTKKIPPSFTWHSINKNKEFIPTFTKKIFRKVSTIL
ncbi:A/G-specific adenine glycosylase [Pelagibacteraceae bacterium]|nr:A/G-specific adenine glycosylase [Pelagibacteraceae bacterium]